MISLTGKLLTLRPPTEQDWEGWLYAMNDLETMHALLPYFKREVWTAEDLKQRYGSKGIALSIIRNTDEKIVGQMYIKDIVPEDKAELGTILHREVWGMGYAEECKLLALTYLFESLNLKTVYFYTAHNNERAKRHLQKIGLSITQSTERGLRYDLPEKDWPSVKNKLHR